MVAKRNYAKRNFDKRATDVLKVWMLSEEHFNHPYPTVEERSYLAAQSGMEPKQVLNWFVNARKRIWQPLLQEMGEDVKRFLSSGRSSATTRSKAPTIGPKPSKRPRLDTSIVLVGLDKDHVTDMEDRALPSKQRRGHWSSEEEDYARCIIDAFSSGILDLGQGITLRAYLAERLNCPPMRISKKFVGESRIGKMFYNPENVNPVDKERLLEKLEVLEARFNQSVMQDSLVEKKRRALKRRAQQLKRQEQQIRIESPSGSLSSLESPRVKDIASHSTLHEVELFEIFDDGFLIDGLDHEFILGDSTLKMEPCIL